MVKNEDLKEVATFLKTARKKSGLSQGKVSKAFGFRGSQYVSNWECSISCPSMKYIPKLCKLYGVETKELRLLIAKVKARRIKKQYGLT